MFRKNGLSQKVALEYDLSCIIKKDDIALCENMTLSFRQKMKDNLFSKNYMKIYFLQIFCKDGLSKKVTFEYDLSCIIWKDDICLYAKI